MKKVMEHYAGAVIATLVAWGVFGIFCIPSFGSDETFFLYLGTMVKEVVFTEAVSVKSGNAFDVYMNRTEPVFTMPDCTQIQSGKKIAVSSILEAVDVQGKNVDILLQNSWDENFQQTDSLEILENTNLYFKNFGVFWVELYTTDNEGRNSHSIVRIFANER